MGAEVYLIHTSVESQGSMAVEDRRSDEDEGEERRRCPADSGFRVPGCVARRPNATLELPRTWPFQPLLLTVMFTPPITRRRVFGPIFVPLFFQVWPNKPALKPTPRRTFCPPGLSDSLII